MMITIPVEPGITLRAIRTDRFKTGCFSINLLQPHRRETASVDALLAAAEHAIDDMERSGLGSDDDAALLRMYYILRWPNGRIAQRLRYASAKYVSDKRAVALMHVSIFVPSRW